MQPYRHSNLGPFAKGILDRLFMRLMLSRPCVGRKNVTGRKYVRLRVAKSVAHSNSMRVALGSSPVQAAYLFTL